jgi:hypothetical protein
MTVAQSGAPTSSLERDARRTNEAHAGEVRPGDIAIGVIIGRTSEFFDFFVYAIASVVVFPKLIFPYVDALTGTLYSFAIFALAFVARASARHGDFYSDRPHLWSRHEADSGVVPARHIDRGDRLLASL